MGRHRRRYHQRKWRGMGKFGAFGCRAVQVLAVAAGLYFIISSIVQIVNNLHSLDWFWIRMFGLAQYALFDPILCIVITIVLCGLVIWFMEYCYKRLKRKYYK